MTPARALLLIPALVAAFVVLPAAPALALEKEIFGDVVVPKGKVVPEVSTAWGDVIVRGRVTGDVHSGYGSITVEGPVGGDVDAGFGDVRVDGPVGGDVRAGFGNLYLEHGARVKGEVGLGYGAVREQHPDASVGGGVETGRTDGRRAGALGMVAKGVATLGFVAAALLVAVVAPRPLRACARRLASAPGRSLLLGIGSVPVVVIFSVVLALSGVGLLLLPLAWPAYLVLLLFGALVTAYALGSKVVLATGRYRAGDTLAAIVGALLVSAVSLIPLLGGVLLAGLVLLGTGAAISALVARRPFRTSRPTYAVSYEDYPEKRRRET